MRIRRGPLCAVGIMSLLLSTAACREDDRVGTLRSIHPEHMPTMSTLNVSTLISDSGITQYRIVSPLWQVYDRPDSPCWIFPKGIYLQKYDPLMRVIATVAADSASYLTDKRIWRLDGHVEIRRVPSDLFASERFFWDTRRHEMYSDTFIHIETATHVLEGVGFESDEHLTDYRILRPQGIFPVDRDALKQ